MKQSVIWFIFISSPPKMSHRYLPYVKVLRLWYNNKIKKKSNHLFVESPPSFCPLTIIHHHPPQFLLLPPRFLPHFCSRSFEIIYHKKPNLCRTDRYNQYLQISHFEEEINSSSFLLLWNLHAQKLSLRSSQTTASVTSLLRIFSSKPKGGKFRWFDFNVLGRGL